MVNSEWNTTLYRYGTYSIKYLFYTNTISIGLLRFMVRLGGLFESF